MQKQFKREQRYFVVKVKDAKKYLDAHQLEKLAEIADTISEGREKGGIPALECVVVESDWPEYESTWRAIEDRVTGAQPAQRMNMQTADQVTQAFKAELQALLDKYGAELSARDTWEGYPECGEDVRMQVAVPAIYDADHNCLREYTEIDLGSWVPTSLPPSKTPARSRQGLSGWRKR